MFWLLKVLIERDVHSLNRPFLYACSSLLEPSFGKRVAIKFAHSTKPIIGFIIDEPEKIDKSLEEYNSKSEFQIKEILELIDEYPIISKKLFRIAEEVAKYFHAPLISVLKVMLPPSLKPSSSFKGKPREAFIKYIVKIKDPDDSLNFNEKKVMAKLEENGRAKFTGFGAKKTVAILLAKKYIDIVDVLQERVADYRHEEYREKQLSDEQKKCIDEIIFSNDDTFLLEGVTGSGKTEVYFRLAEHYLSIGNSVLILEPEIALTSRLVTIFKSRFKNQVSVLHSGETPAVLYDEYQKIARGEARIVIGARSAVFAPLHDLALIVIDEEHVNSYKQENEPFYHARTVALIRQKLSFLKIVLGSATPSLDTKARAEKGLYHQLYLTERFNSKPLPKVDIVDMTDIKNVDSESVIISIPLRKAMTEVLNKEKQVLLFLNRRGYAPIYSCRKCGRIYKCPNCEVPLTYHKQENIIKCHHCEYEISVADLQCQKCGSTSFAKTGFGTQRIVDEIQRLFPRARICRLDKDIASKKKQFAEILNGFIDHEYDIMIGTQMIAKGHDFSNVELVSALMADKSLSIPNYLANENTFDLLTQLIGRAGRNSGEGRAIIQTYMPDNEVLHLSAMQDYSSFYKLEMNNRKQFQYPPYTYLAIITVSAKGPREAEQFSYKIKNYLVVNLKNARASIYGPSNPYIKVLNNRYYKNIMIKYKSRAEVEEAFSGLHDLEGGEFKISLDIDPVSNC